MGFSRVRLGDRQVERRELPRWAEGALQLTKTGVSMSLQYASEREQRQRVSGEVDDGSAHHEEEEPSLIQTTSSEARHLRIATIWSG